MLDREQCLQEIYKNYANKSLTNGCVVEYEWTILTVGNPYYDWDQIIDVSPSRAVVIISDWDWPYHEETIREEWIIWHPITLSVLLCLLAKYTSSSKNYVVSYDDRTWKISTEYDKETDWILVDGNWIDVILDDQSEYTIRDIHSMFSL